MTARYEVQDRIAIITIDNPPINSMGLATRQAMEAAVQRAIMDDGVLAIVITGPTAC